MNSARRIQLLLAAIHVPAIVINASENTWLAIGFAFMCGAWMVTALYGSLVDFLRQQLDSKQGT